MSRLSGFVVNFGRWLTGFNLSFDQGSIQLQTLEIVESENFNSFTSQIVKHDDIQCHTSESFSRTHNAGDVNSTDAPIETGDVVSKIDIDESIFVHCRHDAQLEQTKLLVPIHFPVFTIIISIIQWITFELTYDPENPEKLNESPLITDSDKRYEIWRIFTSLLIHSGQKHLWENLSQQLFAGCILEIVYGWKLVFALYFSAACMADFVESMVLTNIFSYGASGAVAGLTSGNFVAIVMNWNIVSKPKTRLIIFGYLLIEIIALPIISSIKGEDLTYNVSDSGHMGGIIGGFVFGFFLLKSFQPKQWQKRISFLTKFLSTICTGFIVGNVLKDQIIYWIF